MNNIKDWLETITPRDQIDSIEHGKLRALLDDEGFKAFLQLLMGSKELYSVQLANLPLNGPVNHARASVLQGQIKGLELVRQTILELFPPAEGSSDGAAS